jgi:glycosyltransferase involved in cell wall biosynthesis
MKITLFTPRISPARFNYYQLLGTLTELTVVVDRSSRVITSGKDLNFNYIINEGLNLGEYRGLSFKTLVTAYLYRHNLFIIEQYSSPNSALLILFLRLFKKKFILNADGGFINISEKKIIYLIKSLLISSASTYLSSGSNCDKYLKYYGAREQSIIRYPLSSYTLDYLRTLEVNSVIEPNKLVQFVFIGQFIPRKGVDLIISAANHFIGTATFSLIGGDASDLDWIREPIAENVIILGFKDKESVFRLLSSADFHLITSREDIWNYTLMESYAVGKRTISSDASASSIDFLYKPDKFMFKSGDVKDLILKLENAIRIPISVEEKRYYTQMSHKFSTENMTEVIFSSLKEIHIEK